MRVKLFALFLAVLCVLISVPAGAQTTFASITGTITDPTGLAIVGASITATHLGSNYVYTAQANDTGTYTLGQLREGEYTLRIKAAGFKEFVARSVQLVALDVRRIDARLEIGAVEASVEVTAGATLIETETARISDTRTSETLKSLPLNSRGLFDYLALSAGVLQESSTGAQRRYAGSRINQSDATIDGITISDMYGGNQISPLAGWVESYEEVRVDMANNTAEYGAIGMVTVISKSGANQVHGSLFDYYITPGFRARNPFSSARPTGTRHFPGGSVGGPIYLPRIYDGRNKSFFYYSYEASGGSVSQDLLTPTVPPASWRAGDFSALAPATVVKDPAGKLPFPGNRMPASAINPVSRKFQELYYPLPNYPGSEVVPNQNYRELKTREFDPNKYFTARGDHRFSPKSSLFGRFTWNRYYGRGFEALPTLGQSWTRRDTRAVTVSETQTLRPNLLNEVRWGLAYNNFPRHPSMNGKQVVQALGLQGLADNIPDLPGMFVVGFSGIGINSTSVTEVRDPGNRNYIHQWQDHLSWFRGRHTVKAGFMAGRVNRGNYQTSANLFGNVTFSNRFTGFPYADFLAGIPTTVRRAYPPVLTDEIRWTYDYFVTDEWKLTPRLTLSLGLRYEYHPSLHEANNLKAVFDIGTGKIVVPDGTLNKVSPLMPRGYVDVVETKGTGYASQTLLQTDKNNFAPRIGVAWRPLGNNTVFRAGYGIFYDVVPGGTNTGGVPFIIQEPAFTNPSDTPAVVFPRVFPLSVGGPTTVGIPGANRADLRTPYSMQYNATIEHQRWNTGFRASYIGTNTRQGQYSFNINQPLPDNRLFVDKVRRFPNYPAVSYLTNGSGHQYHSLTLEAQRNLARGLSYQFSWVWARDIGDLERADSPENAYDRRRERSVWQDIPTHRTTGNLIYELPFGKGKRFLAGSGRAVRAIAGGWQISAIHSFYSAQFLTPQWTGPDPVGIAYTTSKTPAQVTLRPDILRNPNLPAGERSVSRWFDTKAFAAPAAGSFGTSSGGVIKGPGANVLHGGITKRFDLGERAKLRLEMVGNNLFNHPNWSNPGTSISNAGQVGVIRSTSGVSGLDESGQRSLRAGIRLEW